MSCKYPLLAGAAACAMLLAAAAPADAQSVRHRAAASASTAEVQALRAQVEALTARLDAQQSAQNQAQAQALQAAQASQAAADAQIKSIPTQVNAAVAKLPKAKSAWANDTVVSGRMYATLSNITQKSNGARVAPSGNGFDIKRFYVGVDHKFNNVFSGNVTTDFQYSSAISSTEVYIKKAYLQAKVSDALVLRFGSTDLPWVPFAESLYGYRYVENVMVDRTKFGTSADWGVHASGKLADGKVQYAVSVIDGAGYKAPLRSKTMDIEGRLSVTPIDHLTLGVGGYSGKLGKDIQGATTRHTANRFNTVAAYTTSKFRIGAEYFTAENWKDVTSIASNKSDGYSIFGSYNVTDKASVFGRYDRVRPTKTTNPSTKEAYFNVGVSYEAIKNVEFALLYKRDKVDNGSLSTSNGTIGGLSKGTYDEIGIFGQYRF